MSGEQIFEATEFEQLMAHENFRAEGCVQSHPNLPRSPFGARLSKGGQLSDSEAAIMTVDNSKGIDGIEKAFLPTLLEQTVKVDRAEFFKRWVATVIVPAPYWYLLALEDSINLSSKV